MQKNKNIIFQLIIIFSIVTFQSCTPKDELNQDKRHQFPKVWAHRVNNPDYVADKQSKFMGLEVDLIFSEHQDLLFVGHDAPDTTKNILFSDWLKKLSKAQRKDTYYWLDIKNLSVDNAEQLAQRLKYIARKYHIKDRLWVENTSAEALEIVKEYDFQVLLWVDNFYYNPQMDTTSWYQKTKKMVDELQPDGLSCEYRMYPVLTDYFSDQHIFFWHTPADFTPENIAFTQKLCREKSVKAVLVDYSDLIEY